MSFNAFYNNIKKYLDDNKISYGCSVSTIYLTDKFTEEYFEEIKDDMIESITKSMEELSSETVNKQPAPRKQKNNNKPLMNLDKSLETKVENQKGKTTKNPKEQQKNPKSTPKTSPTSKTPSKTNNKQQPKGKFDDLRIQEEEDNEFSFDEEDGM